MYTTIVILIAITAIGGCLALAWKKPGWAMGLLILTVGAPLIAGAILIETREYSPDGPILIITGILIFLMTVLLIYFKRQSDIDQEPWYKIISRFLFTIIAGILFLAFLTLIFQIFGPILFILFLVLVFRFKQTRRYSLALNVLSTISTAMRQNLPLPMALETAGFGRKDPASRIFRQTAKYLCEGHSLSESLKRAYQKCPTEILATLSAAEAMNQLPQAIAALEQDSIDAVNGFEKVRPVHPAYPLIVGAMACFMVFGLCIFIIPTFAEIVNDVTGGQGHLPASTQLLLSVTQEILHYGIFVLTGLVLGICLIVTFFIYKRRPEKPRLMSRLKDWVKWHTPVVHHFERLLSLQRTIQTLRVGICAGYSFDTIVRQTLRLDVNACFRAKLQHWLRHIETGHPIADSAAFCGLGQPLAWALDEKVNKDNVPQLLEMLEEVYRNRYHYRLNVIHSIFWPFVIVGLGSGIGFVVFSVFSAIVSMITCYMMDYSMP
jgi:type II secretory pathway component PulF